MDHKYNIFLSYSHKDSDIANNLYTKFTNAGLSCFMAEKDIAAAEQWETKIRNAIIQSDKILILITPRSKDSHWIVAEAGAAWVLQKDLIPTLIFVQPNELIEPIRRYQARIIETSDQIDSLVNELVNKASSVDGDICGQWIDPTDNDVVYFKQIGNRVVGFYDYGSGDEKIGVYIGTLKDGVFEYRWKWLNGKYDGYGRMVLSSDGEHLSGDWWYGKNEEHVEHVGYRRKSNQMPKWLRESDFNEYLSFLNN